MQRNHTNQSVQTQHFSENKNQNHADLYVTDISCSKRIWVNVTITKNNNLTNTENERCIPTNTLGC